MDCQWPKTSGYPKMPGKVSKPRRQHLHHFISQQRAPKSQGCAKSGIKLRRLSWRTNDAHVYILVRLNNIFYMSPYKLKLNSNFFLKKCIITRAVSWPSLLPRPPPRLTAAGRTRPEAAQEGRRKRPLPLRASRPPAAA